MGGGGARGALQVGAMRALIEAGVTPDILTGTSVGAVNAAFVAIRGVNLSTIDELVLAWQDAVSAELLPSNFLWFVVRSMFKSPNVDSFHRLKDFFLKHGMTPDIRFSDIDHVKLFLVASDLNSGSPVIYGLDQDDRILDGLLASTALPPWVSPMMVEERYLMDGGAVSPLPIEPAIRVGATSIIDRDVHHDASGFGPFLAKLITTVGIRQRDLELQIAQARGIPVSHLKLTGRDPVPLWDFSRTDELISLGYEYTQKAIHTGELDRSIGLIAKMTVRFKRWFHLGAVELR